MLSFLKSENGEKNSRLRLLLIIGGALLGVVLLLFGSGTIGGNEEEPSNAPAYSVTQDETLIYQTYLEGRIKALCESVRGVGSATVIVSLENGFEEIYATELRDGNEEYVIVGSGSSANALLLSRESPSIRGIGIVCEGGSDPTVRGALISLLSATFHISSNRICITEAR
ncbi:MAG: hypothetical protein IJW16_02535 [Clostridia bacterium]|nr:hypothetical protein [Clostridia bacterium]